MTPVRSTRALLYATLACMPFSAALSVGCDPPPPPPEEDAGPDPNQCVVDVNFNMLTTDPITPGTDVTGTLCPTRDRDLYSFAIANAGQVALIHLKMSTFLTAVEPSYAILKDDGTAEGLPTGFFAADGQKSAGEAVDFVGAHRFEEAGTYAIVVADVTAADRAFDNVNTYALGLEIVSDPDSHEPNNTAETASPLAAGTTTAAIATSGDQDWYLVDVSGNSQIIDARISVPEGSGVDHEVTLYGTLPDVAGGDLVPLGQTRLKAGTTAGVLEGRIRKAGSEGSPAAREFGTGEPYYLVVKDIAVNAEDDDQDAQIDAALGTYTIDLALIANPDSSEGATGNEVPENPTVVASGTTLTAAIATTSDQDVYAITPPAGTGAGAPRVLLVDVTFTGTIDPKFDPQLLVFSADPEVDPLRTCTDACFARCDQFAITCRCLPGNLCGEGRLQRFIAASPFKASFPLRDDQTVYVSIADQGDDAFQDGGTYSVQFRVQDDPDTGEVDDYSIPNLETSFDAEQFANLNIQQLDRSFERARAVPTSIPPACTSPGVPAGCLEVREVIAPQEFAQLPTETLECTGVSDSVTLSGYLSFEGDRDFFAIDVPDGGYWALDFDYGLSGAGNTPLEFLVFAYAGSRSDLRTSFGEIEPATFDGCNNTSDCPDGSICVAGTCWNDGDSNPTFSGHSFPGPGDCALLRPGNHRPLVVQVVDNGINDFDTAVQYNVNLTIRCGCPEVCNGSVDVCQGEAAP